MEKPEKKDAPPHDPIQLKKIAERAYHLWEMRGRSHGNDIKDWLEAEWFILGMTKRTPDR